MSKRHPKKNHQPTPDEITPETPALETHKGEAVQDTTKKVEPPKPDKPRETASEFIGYWD